MNYNTFQFWLLFLMLYAFYWRVPHRWQNRLLLVASYVFYGFWDYRFLFLILLSTMVDFVGGLGVAGRNVGAAKIFRLGALLIASAFILCSHIDYHLFFEYLRQLNFAGAAGTVFRPYSWSDLSIPLGTAAAVAAYGLTVPALFRRPEQQRKKIFLWISMVTNLLILGFFKYFDFFVTSFADLLTAIGVADPGWPLLNLILPAGISFYTFQAMSYTIDVYRNDCEPTESFADFALFVCFFPHLVAGPIMRAHNLMPQVIHPRYFAWDKFAEGAYLIVIGTFKKLVIADNLADVANAVFNGYALKGAGPAVPVWNGVETLVGVLAFAMQIYCDFSGYSAVARGVSKWLGFELVVNFHQPYWSVSPSDFWRRWHISLSSWLRDYLYIPLGGNRFGAWSTYRNLMITMLLGGLWHGARWNFVAWGLFHGLILCLYRLLNFKDPQRRGPLTQRLRWFGAWSLMFALTCFGWLLFRAPDVSTALNMLAGLTRDWDASRFAGPAAKLMLFYALPVLLLEMYTDGEERISRLLRKPWYVQAAVFSYLIMMIVIFQAATLNDFIYFQF